MAVLAVLAYCLGISVLVNGQGRLLEPPGRASLGRLGYDKPINYNDNLQNCGGTKHRWLVNKGKCGVCGDPWESNPKHGGNKNGADTITRSYQSGSVIETISEIQTSGGGFLEIQICDVRGGDKQVTEDCLEGNSLKVRENGDFRFYDIVFGINRVEFVLPENLSCKHCVLRWKYRSADQYGCDTDVTTNTTKCGFGLGHFHNEYFACADISIINSTTSASPTKRYQSTVNEQLGGQGPIYKHALSRKKRTLHMNFARKSTSRAVNSPPYISIPENQSFRKLPFTRLGRPTTEQGPRWRWSSEDIRRMQQFNVQPKTRFQNAQSMRLPSRNFPNNVDISRLEIGQGEMFPGSIPVPSLIKVDQPVVRQILRTSQTPGTAAALTSPVFRQIDTTQIQNTFMDPLNPEFGPQISVQTVNHHVFSKHKIATKQCNACPFDQCLDKTLELDNIFPGLFEKPVDFLECKKYQKLFSLGKYKVLSEGLPSCSHPRFRRQLRTIPRIDDDDFGCCGTRPQVVLPLTVESDSQSFNVVQLPNERSQFLVQGICGNNSTTSCSSCVAENNFQWVLVYDPRVNTSPPVSFVPVKFPHYCRCLNPGRRFVG